MNRQSRTIAVLVVGIAMAGAASYAVYRTVQRMPVQQVEVANYKVVVAAKPLSMGARLTEADLKLVAWPASNKVANGHSDIASIVNRGLLSSVVENEPITESKLAPLEAGAGLSPTIPQGMRALSVRVNEVVGVAGFTVPGTKVDVLVTMRAGKDSMTKTVVNNVQVLTSGTAYDQDKAKDGRPIQSTVVTLLVSPADGEKIALAQSQGEIMLALRNPLDVADAGTTGAQLGNIFGPPAKAEPQPTQEKRPQVVRPRVALAPAAPPPPQTQPYMVESIKGQKKTVEELKEVIRFDPKPGIPLVNKEGIR
jgi:pilus assembly protein CpaB